MKQIFQSRRNTLSGRNTLGQTGAVSCVLPVVSQLLTAAFGFLSLFRLRHWVSERRGKTKKDVASESLFIQIS